MPLSVALIYHFPLDLREHYTPFAERFTASLHACGVPCELFLATSKGELSEKDKALFAGLPWTMADAYQGNGCDVGSYLSIAPVLGHDFAVFCGATTYFPKPRWFERLLEAREKHGEGLYGISASFEGSPLKTNPAPHPHIRTSCFACNPKLLTAYPKTIVSREDCYRFENGEWRISRYISPTRVVYFDSVCDLRDCRNPPNIFRRGNQSNLLVFDRRTDEYANANQHERTRLERLADGDVVHFPI